MSRNFLLLLAFVIFLFSCNSESKRKLFNLRKNYPPSLIQNHLLFSDFSDEFSFPNWFNDSLVKMHNIEKITRHIYPKRLTEASRGDSLLNVPSETIVYTFRENGSIENIQRTFYFDDRVISSFEFLYKKESDQDGFSDVRVIQNNKPNWQANKTETLDFPEETYNLYDKINNDDRFIRFENRSTGDYLYVLPKKENWGTLNIDRFIRPNPADKLLLGETFAPKKTYQVENKVNETHVVQYNYKKGSIKSIKKNNYPFRSTRSFLYDKRGYCTGYIDSTFSDESYLTRTISNFENNMIFSPTKIYHRKENSENKLTLINYEEFIYEYRK